MTRPRNVPAVHDFARLLRLLILIAVALLNLLMAAPDPASAVIERIYTLPFYDSFSITCGFGCYAGHEGTDYVVGVSGVGGERIAAAAPGIGGIPKDKLKVFFWVAEGVQKPLEQWLMEGKNSPGQISPPVVISQSEVTLGGRQGLVEVTETDDARSTSYYVPLNGARVFVVNSGPSDSDVWPQFERVVASLRFAQ